MQSLRESQATEAPVLVGHLQAGQQMPMAPMAAACKGRCLAESWHALACGSDCAGSTAKTWRDGAAG